jgi:hypothetical protein
LRARWSRFLVATDDDVRSLEMVVTFAAEPRMLTRAPSTGRDMTVHFRGGGDLAEREHLQLILDATFPGEHVPPGPGQRAGWAAYVALWVEWRAPGKWALTSVTVTNPGGTPSVEAIVAQAYCDAEEAMRAAGLLVA